MSQSETLMLIVLGFSIATFLALIIGRLAWKLAVRIGARRVQKNVPVTVVDLQNDRDRLRAEQAILARKIEVRLDEMKLRMAEQSAEVTRNRNRVESLMQQITEQESVIAARDKEIARLNGLVSGLQRELSSLKSSSENLQQSIKTRDVEMASLQEKVLSKLEEARAAAPSPAPAVIQQSTPEEVRARLSSRIREITNITKEIANPKPVPSDGNVNTGDVTDRILVKPSDSQQIQSKPKVRAIKKATRSESAPALEAEAAAAAAAAVAVERPAAEASAAPAFVEIAVVAASSEAVKPEAPTEAPPQEQEPRQVTNVISLAQRIKALQREIAS